MIQNVSEEEIQQCVATVVGFNCSAPRTILIENGGAQAIVDRGSSS